MIRCISASKKKEKGSFGVFGERLKTTGWKKIAAHAPQLFTRKQPKPHGDTWYTAKYNNKQ